MPNGSPDSHSNDPQPGLAAQEAGSAFPDAPPGSSAPCLPAPPGSGAGSGPAWTAADIKNNLAACDGGLDIWNKAKTANGGKEPVIKEGASVIGTGASVDCGKGVVTVDPGQNKCETSQWAIFELTNLTHCSKHAEIMGPDCTGGVRSKEEFIRANERLEYQSLQNTLKAFDSCKSTWGCGATATALHDGYRSAKDFDDYYDRYIPDMHKKYYADYWDANCKAAYEAKHPPASTPVSPPSGPAPKSSCFIATAAYGSPNAAEVQFLRELRDLTLRKTDWGSRFFDEYWSYYYRISPAIAAEMDRDPTFRTLMRWSIVTPWMNYLRLLVARPVHWNLDNVDPELRTFLEFMRTGMEKWLAEIDVPQTFAGRGAAEVVAELNIALGLILRDKEKRRAYLNHLLANGSLPLRPSLCEEAALRGALRAAGRTEQEIRTILYGDASADDVG
jgi:hypothetical protein